MSFFDKLDELRARPEAERRRLVVWISILITLVLFVLWLLNLRYLWQNSEVPEAPSGEPSAWSQALTRIKTGWQTITNQI